MPMNDLLPIRAEPVKGTILDATLDVGRQEFQKGPHMVLEKHFRQIVSLQSGE